MTTEPAAAPAIPAEEEQQQDKAPDSANSGGTQPDASPEFSIPESYKEKPWATKIRSSDDLWKQVDNLQHLAGKKSVVPDFQKATPKEVEDYISQLRPENTDSYTWPEGTPDEQKEVFNKMLHEIGLPPVMANPLIEKYLGYEGGLKEQMYGADGFTKELETSFGKDHQEISGKTAKLLSANLNKEDKELLDKAVPNKILGMIYRLTANLQKQYGISESGAPGEGSEGKTTPTDKTEERNTLRQQIAELKKREHTDEEYSALANKLAETYK